jgi:pimeloyl-ACP methyl ester carboxylesterase
MTARHNEEAGVRDCCAIVNGLRIHYLEWGTQGKPPLLLLHGIARVAHSFDHAAPHFESRYRVIAVDMRGHGDSDWDPQGAYLVEDYFTGCFAARRRAYG